MTDFLFNAHSGLRYLVLLAGIIAVVYLLATRSRPNERPGRILTSVYSGVLDLQIVLGLLLMASGVFYGALMGHLVMMLLAAVAAHGAAVIAKRSEDVRRAATLRLIGIAISLLLIVAGISAIGRSIFGSGQLSM